MNIVVLRQYSLTVSVKTKWNMVVRLVVDRHYVSLYAEETTQVLLLSCCTVQWDA
jgi:hypothetical protein